MISQFGWAQKRSLILQAGWLYVVRPLRPANSIWGLYIYSYVLVWRSVLFHETLSTGMQG